jgi:tetratricopeptide (TPR) repeat protein
MSKDQITSEINELKKKLEENPDSLVFAPLADAYRKQGSLNEAYEICKKGLRKHPTYTSAQVVLGRIYREQGKIGEASAELKKVLDVDPENIMAHSLLGSIYIEKSEYQAAIEEYQKVLTLNPDDEEAQVALKQAIEKAASEQQNPDKTFKKEATLSEIKTPVKESTATITIAELYLKQGHFDKAIEVFQELLANDPQNLMLRQKLSEAVERQQKESAVGPAVSKLKKNEFTQPPDHKEDVLVEESKVDAKKSSRKKENDSKFTSEDILQVMRRGGKDDVLVEEKNPTMPIKQESAPEESKVMDNKTPQVKLDETKIDALKGVLAELGTVEGIRRCFLIGGDGIIVVSIGETSNNADLGNQVAAIFESTKHSVYQLHQGRLQQVLVTAETGHILLISFSDFVLIVLANSKINLGLLRLTLESVTKKVEKIL